MRATVQGTFIRAVLKPGDGRALVTGGFYQAPEDGRIEVVEFYADPADVKGILEVPEHTRCSFDVTASAKSSQYADTAYMSVKLHAFRPVQPERAAARS